MAVESWQATSSHPAADGKGIALGIDTGGTYTDAVLVDQSSGAVLYSAKALTTHYDLAVGIEQAVSLVLGGEVEGQSGSSMRPKITMVGLSTTLATNAIVEGQGSPVCLILIGYDPSLIEQYGLERDLVTSDVVYIRGGHDAEGNEVAPLDEAELHQAVMSRQGRVAAFAVSGYFGVRNPAHEQRACELIEMWTGGQGQLPLPVTCAHELTTRLNAVRRATTAALNAGLIPLLRGLITTVRRTLDSLGVLAPLMIVKGDGSLVRAAWAMRRPIETILSGPAASVIGAAYVAGQDNMWVVDVGGTTTDIAVLHDGFPRINPEGARVGAWRTMVEAIDVHTVGLGGDSHVRLDGEMGHGSIGAQARAGSVRHGYVSSLPGGDGVFVGPQRVVPLSLLASQYPQVVDELRRQVAARQRMRLSGQFVLLHRQPDTVLAANDQNLLDLVRQGPRSFIWIADHVTHGTLVVRQFEQLIARHLVRGAAFTPTDALHVLGHFTDWDVEAARLGAILLAAQADMTPEAFCEHVVAQVSNRVTAELVSKVLGDEVMPDLLSLPDWQREPAARALLTRAMGDVPWSDLGCQFLLRQPVVAVGAPVAAYLPRAARQLNTELIIPPHAGVANAIGAIVGSVVQRLHLLIRPIDAESFFRLYLPDGIYDAKNLEQAVAYARQVVPAMVEAMAHEAGADQVEVRFERLDHTTPLKAEWGQRVFLETELIFTAVGRPGLA